MPETKTLYLVDIEAEKDRPVDLRTCNPEETSLVRVRDDHYLFRFKGKCVAMTVEGMDRKNMRLWTGHRPHQTSVRDERDQLLAEWGFTGQNALEQRELTAPMPGLVLSVLVSEGDTVETGQPLLVLEAMKMENELRAEMSGTVRAVRVQPGDAVTKQHVLIEFEA